MFFVFGDISHFYFGIIRKAINRYNDSCIIFLVYQWKMIFFLNIKPFVFFHLLLYAKLLLCISIVKHIFVYQYKTLFLFLKHIIFLLLVCLRLVTYLTTQAFIRISNMKFYFCLPRHKYFFTMCKASDIYHKSSMFLFLLECIF